MSTHSLWALATDTICGGWSTGTVTEEENEYAEVYLTRVKAEQELADLIRERLTLFIENPESYGDIETALDCGYQAIEATMREDGTVLIAGEEKGMAPPAIRLALNAKSNGKDQTC